MENNLKICVAGIGGVGGFLSAMLYRKYGEQLTLIARGKRGETLRSTGLHLHSDMLGELCTGPITNVTDDISSIGIQDIIFICVKNYSLDSIFESIRPAVGPETILIPIMNGIEPGDRVRSAFPEAIGIDGLVYCNITAQADFSILQRGGYVRVFVGSKVEGPRQSAASEKVQQLLQAADIECHFSPEIEKEIWKKYILNCAFNTITARYNMTTGELRKDPAKVSDFMTLLEEAYSVAVHAGIPLTEETLESHKLLFLEKQAPGSTSSLRGDVWGSKNSELDAFTGALIRKADSLNVPVPLSRSYHLAIQEIMNKRLLSQ